MKFFPLLTHSAHRLGLEAELKEEAPKLTGAVLDVGSKDRRYDHLFPGTVTACDIEENSAKNVEKADIHDLPYRNNSFDNLACLEVLEYTTDPRKALAELLRVTKPGGTILISVPFLTYFHDDMFRPTENWFAHQLKGKEAAYELRPIGNAFTVIIDVIRRKTIEHRSFIARLLLYPVLFVGGFFLPKRPSRDSRFATGYFVTITKSAK